MAERIGYETEGAVARIRFQNPEALNAVDPEMLEALQAAFERAEREARAILLTGEGKAFCSGANLASPRLTHGPGHPDFDAGAILESHYNPLIARIPRLSIPLVAAVNGAAAGVGCSFALLADLVLAAESAYFLQAFRRIGLIPDGGSTWLLPRHVGRVRAMEMMLLGEKISAAQALEWGLINRVVPDAELQGAAMDMAQRLAAGPASLGLIRRAAWAAQHQDLASQLRLERDLQRDAGRTSDFVEGVSAFLGKRPANFQGR